MVRNKTQQQPDWAWMGSRLPEFTDEEKRLLNRSSDFFAVQMYTSRYIEPWYGFPNNRVVHFRADKDGRQMCDVRWEQSPSMYRLMKNADILWKNRLEAYCCVTRGFNIT